MHIPNDAAPYKDVLDGAQVRVFQLVEHDDIIEFNVEVLVDGFEGATDGNVVLQLDGHGLLGQGFEEAVKSLVNIGWKQSEGEGSGTWTDLKNSMLGE